LNKFKNSKYELDQIIDGILYVLKTGISWRDSKSCVKWNSLYFHFQRFVSFNIFKKLYIKLRSIYLYTNTTNVFIIDSSFIQNKWGKNYLARNKFFKNKKCNKISLMTDTNGIPISVLINSGNVHDLSFLNEHINDLFITYKFNKNKTILLADKSYESKNFRHLLNTYKCQLMIPKKQNMKITYPFNKQLYKKRIIIEHTFQKLKNFRRIMIRYDSILSNFLAFLFLAVSQIIYKHIQ
jgi:transposase